MDYIEDGAAKLVGTWGNALGTKLRSAGNQVLDWGKGQVSKWITASPMSFGDNLARKQYKRSLVSQLNPNTSQMSR